MTALNMLDEFKDILETTLQNIKYGCHRETIIASRLGNWLQSWVGDI